MVQGVLKMEQLLHTSSVIVYNSMSKSFPSSKQEKCISVLQIESPWTKVTVCLLNKPLFFYIVRQRIQNLK